MPVPGSFGGDLYYQVAELQGLLVLTVASEHSSSEESQSDSPNCGGFCKTKGKGEALSTIPVLHITHTSQSVTAARQRSPPAEEESGTHRRGLNTRLPHQRSLVSSQRGASTEMPGQSTPKHSVMRRWCSRLYPPPPKHLKGSERKKVIPALSARLPMDMSEAVYIRSISLSIFIPLNATADLMASQNHTHLDQHIMFSFVCATFPHPLFCQAGGRLGIAAVALP